MHAKPDLRVVLKWMITGSGSVITDVIWLSSMKSTALYLLIFAGSMGLGLFLLHTPRIPSDANAPRSLKLPVPSTPVPRERKRKGGGSVTANCVLLLEEVHGYGGKKFWDTKEYGVGDGTLITIFECDEHSMTEISFQLPVAIIEGEKYELLPMIEPDAESGLPIGQMHAFRWMSSFYTRSLTVADLSSPASITALEVTDRRLKFRLTVGCVGWLNDFLPIDEVFDVKIAR